MPSEPDSVVREWPRRHVGRAVFGTSPTAILILE
jgi:hypothetical protein